jgi:hypothetical protein
MAAVELRRLLLRQSIDLDALNLHHKAVGLLVKDQINILSISSRRLYPVQQKKTRPEILFQTSLTLVFPLQTREAGDS